MWFDANDSTHIWHWFNPNTFDPVSRIWEKEVDLTTTWYEEILRYLSPIKDNKNVKPLVEKIEVLLNKKGNNDKKIARILENKTPGLGKLINKLSSEVSKFLLWSQTENIKEKYSDVWWEYLGKPQLMEIYRVLLNIEQMPEAKILLLQVTYNLMYITKIEGDEEDCKIYNKTFNRIMQDDTNQYDTEFWTICLLSMKARQSFLYDLSLERKVA